jgi:hypothetical protein
VQHHTLDESGYLELLSSTDVEKHCSKCYSEVVKKNRIDMCDICRETVNKLYHHAILEGLVICNTTCW